MTTGTVAVDDFLALRDTLRRVREENVRLERDNEALFGRLAEVSREVAKLHAALEEARLAVRQMRQQDDLVRWGRTFGTTASSPDPKRS